MLTAIYTKFLGEVLKLTERQGTSAHYGCSFVLGYFVTCFFDTISTLIVCLAMTGKLYSLIIFLLERG